MEQKFTEINFRKFGKAREVVFFSGNYGKCCSIPHWKFTEVETVILSKWKARMQVLTVY